MKLGKLTFEPVENKLDSISEPTRDTIQKDRLSGILVAEIDPSLSDTAAFCEKYEVGMETSVNCVIVEAKRGEERWYAAVLVGGLDRADVNGVVRKALEAKKISFAPMDKATGLSKMEYGAITPIGLPTDWKILVDSKVSSLEHGIIGSGIRNSKLLVSGQMLASLPNAKVIDLAKN